MRTNIDIDDDLMQAALRGSEFKTKKDAVEAGLKLLARQAHYREVLKWKGKLHWDDQPDPAIATANRVMERTASHGAKTRATKPALASPKPAPRKRKTAEAA
jgi:antitoxin ParD1/3/4